MLLCSLCNVWIYSCVTCGFLVCVMCAFLGCVMCVFVESVLCAGFEIVLCAFFRRWLAASRLAARFARVARFAPLFVMLISVRDGMITCSFLLF